MRSEYRPISLAAILLLGSCGEELIRSVESFQPISSLLLHKYSRNNDSSHHHPLEIRSQQRNRHDSSIYSSTLFDAMESKGGLNDEDTEIVRSRVLQDQGPLSPMGEFLSSLPSIPLLKPKPGNNNDPEEELNTNDLIKTLFKKIANLSLQDYYWRSDLFKKNEADRRVEESLARMMGEDAAYVRPMDAGENMGPLGRAEKQLVDWLKLVIEEEGRRARLIASSDGEFVRPMDLQQSDKGGPLAALENSAVNFLESIKVSETERVRTATLRPKDVDQDKRGPLGNFEARVVSALEEIRASEEFRMEQTRARGGEIVRPIDVPGPLGEAERWYLELITAEKQRGKERIKNDGKLVRPKDASLEGPLGAAERAFTNALGVVRDEETERLRSMQRVLNENRPMERDRNSIAGWTEALLVGIFRAPQLLFRVIDRVNELMESEKLDSKDEKILKEKK